MLEVNGEANLDLSYDVWEFYHLDKANENIEDIHNEGVCHTNTHTLHL